MKLNRKNFGNIVVLFLLTAPFNTFPKTNESHEEERLRHHVAVSGTLSSSDTYSIEGEYHFMLMKYLGIGGAIGYWSNYFDDGKASGPGWSVSDDFNKPSNLYLRPSLILKSPGLKYKETTWSLFAEPGIMLNIPYRRVEIESTRRGPWVEYDYISTNEGQWLALELRLGINIDIDQLSFSAGYFMSNLDIYSQYRHLSYRGVSFKDYYPDKPFMQGGYLTISYSF